MLCFILSPVTLTRFKIQKADYITILSHLLPNQVGYQNSGLQLKKSFSSIILYFYFSSTQHQEASRHTAFVSAILQTVEVTAEIMRPSRPFKIR